MHEKKFRELLDKYLNESITDSEKELLGSFRRELKLLNKEPLFSGDTHKKEIKEALWSNIQMHISKVKLRKRRRLIASAVAAVFIGLITTSYLFFNNAASHISNSIPENSITLQLEDGTIKVIDESDEVEVLDAQGRVVGQQNGTSLKYTNTKTIKKLVYNTLTVPYGKTFELRLSDGTLAHLNAGSSIKYPIQFIEGQDRKVSIIGEAYLDVAKDAKHPFIVNANNLNVRVLGTQFNVSAYPEDETTEVVLVEGSVSLYTKSEGYNVDTNTLLEPGYKGSFNRQENSVSKNKVMTGLYTSWINGELVFRNMTFGNILKKMERHYNVIISNNNSELTYKKFNANFGSEPIENVLEELKRNYEVEYEILENNTIIIK